MILTWWRGRHAGLPAGGILAGNVAGTGALLLVLYMYGIGKAALMPFHRWLPAAMVAPTPVRRCCMRSRWSRPACSRC
jgi:multicomponent Na+:H+ antiporter subunit D